MKVLVTGCSGFVGSNLVDKLLLNGCNVIGIDNFSTGHSEFIRDAQKNDNFEFECMDLTDAQETKRVIKNVDVVFHLSANADVQNGFKYPKKDLQQNTIVTFNVLDAMRENFIGRMFFSSTSSVYGDTSVFPTPENDSMNNQTSLYGASKLASEALIQAYTSGYGIQANIFRFSSLLGPRYSHGHIFHFMQQLKEHPDHLIILGNGKQQKNYLHVDDCLDAMLYVLKKEETSTGKIEIYNLATDETTNILYTIAIMIKELGLEPVLSYTSTNKKGWVGDEHIELDTTKIREFGWSPKRTIKDGVLDTVRYLKDNEWLLEEE